MRGWTRQRREWRPRRAGRILAALGVLLMAARPAVALPPTIGITHLPPYGSSQDLTGRVENASPAGHGVAVYIFVGGWWTKPTSGNPLTPIQPDGAWACDITTGGDDAYATRVAAFLVPTNYAPPILLPAPTFPTDLLSNARASVDVARPYTRRLWFSGYEWSVKDSRGGRVGPGTNYFSDSNSNVWVDAAGRLHLALTPRAGGWNCAEVVSVRSFGVGTYRAVLDGAADALDREAVLGLFTWHDDAAHAHREMDVEVTRWGDAADTNNAQFVVQPYELPGHRVRYRVPPAATNSTHSFAWWPDRIDFTAHAGAYELPPLTGTPVAAWTFSAPGVPAPGGENLRFNLWLSNSDAPAGGAPVEVVLRRFVFVPETIPAPRGTGARLTEGSGPALTFAVEPQVAYRRESSADLAAWADAGLAVAATDVVEVVAPPGAGSRLWRLTAPAQ